MQRRAAAIFVAFFLVIGAASYALIATASEPAVELQNADQQLTQGGQFTVDGQQYTVTNLEAELSGGGHGAAPSLSRSGTIAWTEQSSQYTATWEADATVTYQDDEWQVVVPNESDPSSVTLREVINRTAILQDDPDADNETVTRNGEEYVVVTNQDGTATLVPADEYFPTPRTRQFTEGQRFQYVGNQTTVDAVAQSGATLTWTAPREQTASLSDGANVTLSGQTYLVHFVDNSTVQLSQDFGEYEREQQDIEQFHTHVNGLWGVSIVSLSTVVLLLGMAYLPSRY